MLVERWLRIIGIGTWLIAGSTSVPRLVRDPEHAWPWLVAFIAFGVLFWIGSDRHAARGRRVACLVGQTGLAVVLAVLGMPAFEGALLALVAAQVPLALPVWASLAWALAQVPALWLVLPGDYNRIEIAKSLSAYIAFAAFAITVVRLFESERRARVELARAGERVRIAREIHDVLGHHLASLSIQLDLARRTAKDESREPLDEAYGIAKRMLHDVRSTVTALRKDEYDLRTALQAIIKAVPEPPVTLDFPAKLVVGDAACAHVALRCVQEAITNTVKHAHAQHIVVALAREGQDLMVSVEDDGNAKSIQPGSGLRGMRERIEELGGTLEVSSVTGRGTTVRARLPMGQS